MDFLQGMSNLEQTTFKRICNRLFVTCFVIKKNETTKSDYYFILRHRPIFEEYIKVLGYRLDINEEYGVVQMVNQENTNRLNLKLFESIILILLRILYDEKRSELSLSNDVIIDVGEIQDKYLALKIRDKLYDENSSIYEDIHLMMQELEHRHIITIVWKDKLRKNVISKVVLNQDFIDDAYAYVKRVKKQEINENGISFFKNYPYQSSTGRAFGSYLINQIEQNPSIKKYVDMEELQVLKDILVGLEGVLNNRSECYVRELSIFLFGDSKKLETLTTKIIRIILDFDPRSEELSKCTDLLAKFNVLKNPSYVFLKGTGTIELKTLLEYRSYAKKLTVNDRSEIQRLLTDEFFENSREILEAMLKYDIKLEQEIII